MTQISQRPRHARLSPHMRFLGQAAFPTAWRIPCAILFSVRAFYNVKDVRVSHSGEMRHYPHGGNSLHLSEIEVQFSFGTEADYVRDHPSERTADACHARGLR